MAISSTIMAITSSTRSHYEYCYSKIFSIIHIQIKKGHQTTLISVSTLGIALICLFQIIILQIIVTMSALTLEC